MMDFDVDLGGIFQGNDTYDYDNNYEYKDESEHGASTEVWIPLLYLALLVWGLLGNGLLLTVLSRKKRSWSTTDIFVLHLCIADALLLLTLPLLVVQAFQRCGWRFNFGLIPCKISRVLFYVNFYCWIFLLNCMVLDHYLFCCHRIRLYWKNRPSFAHLTCLCVWICSLVLVSPKWIYVVTSNVPGTDKTLCYENSTASSGEWPLVSRLLHHTLGFLLPAAILVVLVTLRLHGGAHRSHQQRAFMVLLSSVVLFLLLWMPYNVTLIVDTVKSQAEETWNSPETALLVTSLLGYGYPCLKPLLHLSLSPNFRAQALGLLRCAPVEPAGSLWKLGVGEDEQTQRNHTDGEQEQMTSDHQMQSSQC